MNVAERIEELSPWYQSFEIDGVRVPSRGVSGDRLWRKFRHMLPPLPDRKVLDLGCNAGYMSYQAAMKGADVLGIDNSGHVIEQAEFCRGYFSSPIPPRFTLMDLDLFESDEVFHLVLALSILYHLKDPIGLLARLKFDHLLVRTRSDKLDGGQADAMADSLGLHVVSRFVESQRRELILYARSVDGLVHGQEQEGTLHPCP